LFLAGSAPMSPGSISLLVSRVVEVNELFQALDVTVVKELLLEVRAGASVLGHCGGVMATLRAEDTCIVPSTIGACGIQLAFGLAQEPNRS